MPDPFLPDAAGLHARYAAEGPSFNVTGPAPADATMASEVARLAKLPLLFHPGTQWMYSFATDVLGRVLEVVSGQRLDDFVQARILGPLQMRDTGFVVPRAHADRVAACYIHTGAPGPAPASADGKTNSFDFSADRSQAPGYAALDMGEGCFARHGARIGQTAAGVACRSQSTFPWWLEAEVLSGGGGLFGTGLDYVRFCQMLLNKGRLVCDRPAVPGR